MGRGTSLILRDAVSVVKRLVELHGGTVHAYSAGRGQGAEFAVRLPMVDAEIEPVADLRVPAAGARKGVRVLVVDDADLVEMLSIVVEQAGHEVRKAFDGPSAVSAAVSFRPQVIFLDLGLPGMSGLEVAAELRKKPELTGVRLVALTGWGQPEDRRQTEAAGFDHHLPKPTDPEEVQRLLDDLAEHV